MLMKFYLKVVLNPEKYAKKLKILKLKNYNKLFKKILKKSILVRRILN